MFALRRENNQIIYSVLTTTGLRNAHAAKRLVEMTEVTWLTVHSLPVCTFCYKVRFGFRANVSPLLFDKKFLSLLLFFVFLIRKLQRLDLTNGGLLRRIVKKV